MKKVLLLQKCQFPLLLNSFVRLFSQDIFWTCDGSINVDFLLHQYHFTVSWTCSMYKFRFCQNCDISNSSYMLLHQPYDGKFKPGLGDFLQMSGNSIDI